MRMLLVVFKKNVLRENLLVYLNINTLIRQVSKFGTFHMFLQVYQGKVKKICEQSYSVSDFRFFQFSTNHTALY